MNLFLRVSLGGMSGILQEYLRRSPSEIRSDAPSGIRPEIPLDIQEFLSEFTFRKSFMSFYRNFSRSSFEDTFRNSSMGYCKSFFRVSNNAFFRDFFDSSLRDSSRSSLCGLSKSSFKVFFPGVPA